MKMFKSKLMLVFCLSFGLVAQTFTFAQDSITAEGEREIIRRGNHIEVIDGTQASDSIGAAMAPPEDDSHKWFISVVSDDNCKYCDQLKNDFKSNKYLQAWVNTESPAKSFTHYNIYKINDKTQATWRFKNLRFKGVPSLIIQPPLNGEYGHPSTVVAQYTGYNGDPKALSTRISNSISTYVETINRKNVNNEGHQSGNGFGQRQPRPDFLPPDVDRPNILPNPNTPNDLIPPELEGLKPKIPSLPSMPDFLSGDSPFLLVLGGLFQMLKGIVTLIYTSIQTIIMLVILGMLASHLYSKKSKSVENDQ